LKNRDFLMIRGGSQKVVDNWYYNYLT
jgi:hypothetical protein